MGAKDVDMVMLSNEVGALFSRSARLHLRKKIFRRTFAEPRQYSTGDSGYRCPSALAQPIRKEASRHG